MEAKQIKDDWLGFECKSGLILFYYNKQTGEHKWPCCSKCPEKGLHSNETSSSDGSVHQGRVTSVSIGTQTDDGGCGNGCTSIYIINKDMKTKESLQVGQSNVENHSNSLDKKANRSSCVQKEIPQEIVLDIGNENCDHYDCSEQSVAAEREFQHKRKRVIAEETLNSEEPDNDFHKTAEQEKKVLGKSGENVKRKYGQVSIMNSSQPFMNLQNVSKIVIENPHSERNRDSSSPQILEMKMPDGSSSLADSCITTGSPIRKVSDTDPFVDDRAVGTGIPTSEICVARGDCSPNEIATFNEKRKTTGIPGDHSPVEISLDSTRINTGIPRANSPFEISLDGTHIDTGIPRDHSPKSSSAEIGFTTGTPNKQAFDYTNTGSPHSSQQVNYTHVIHVDTAITSGNENSNLSSLGNEASARYRVIAYPKIEEECIAGFREQAAASGHITTSPLGNMVQGDQKFKSQPRFLASPNRLCGCPLCDTVLPNTKTFFEHLFSHCDWKARECAICKKTFSNKCGLERHLRSHASYRPHECVRCGKMFLCSHHLKAHLMTHENGKATKVCGF